MKLFFWYQNFLLLISLLCLYSVCLLTFSLSHIRECLKLDPDDKDCFSHYKQVKKLSKQLDSAEELIQEERLVLLRDCCIFFPLNHHPPLLLVLSLLTNVPQELKRREI